MIYDNFFKYNIQEKLYVCNKNETLSTTHNTRSQTVTLFDSKRIALLRKKESLSITHESSFTRDHTYYMIISADQSIFSWIRHCFLSSFFLSILLTCHHKVPMVKISQLLSVLAMSYLSAIRTDIAIYYYSSFLKRFIYFQI